MTDGSEQFAWTDNATLDAIRPKLREMLLAGPAYSQLKPAEQQAIVSQMAKVAAYIANPNVAIAEIRLVATAQADNVSEASKRASENRAPASSQFRAAAVNQGLQQFGELVQKGDFPNFVGGLLQNVFQAIVDSSIQQMREYGELLANVAKVADEFAQHHISENNARDWLSAKFPDMLGIEVSSYDTTQTGVNDTATQLQLVLVATGDDPSAGLKKVSEELGLDKPVTDLSSPEDETRLVLAARQKMVCERQQLLASMLLLGINRTVVTDGQINTKVLFDVYTEDVGMRRAREDGDLDT